MPRIHSLAPSTFRLFALVALALSIYTGRASADVGLNTFGPGDAFSTFALTNIGGPNLPPPAAAIRFTLPWPGRVQSITLAISSSAPQGKTIEIWSDGASGQEPGAPIAQLTVNGVTTAPGVVTVTSAAGPSLASGTHYWLILRQLGAPTTKWYPGQPAIISTWYLQDPFTGVWVPTAGGPIPAVRMDLDAPGACCAPDLTCVTLTRTQCDSFHGDYRGPATVCSPSPCIVSFPQGACCRGTTCWITNVITCTISGQFLGAGSTCTPIMAGGSVNPCCRGDFDNSGAKSVQDLFDFLNAYFSNCP